MRSAKGELDILERKKGRLGHVLSGSIRPRIEHRDGRRSIKGRQKAGQDVEDPDRPGETVAASPVAFWHPDPQAPRGRSAMSAINHA